VYKEELIEGILKMNLGNPEEESTFIGPLTNKEDLHSAMQLVILCSLDR